MSAHHSNYLSEDKGKGYEAASRAHTPTPIYLIAEVPIALVIEA